MSFTGQQRRILMTTDAIGGVWHFSCLLARGLARHGFQIELLVLGPAPGAPELEALARAPDVRVIVTGLALEWIDKTGADVARAEETLAAIASARRPDLVHVNGYREALVNWGAPVLLTAHSCVNSWWLACRDAEPPADEWDAYTRRVAAALAAANAWTAPSEAMRQCVADIYRPPAPGIVVANGIDLDEIAEPPLVREPAILSAGRLWDEGKNVSDLEAVAAGLPWPVRLAGLTAAAAEAAAVSPAPSPAVEWLGALSRSALLDEMARVEIYAAPARYEPFGYGILEAAASGCTLVLGDIPSLRETWDGAALFVPPGDRTALSEALTALTAEPERRDRLRRAGMARARRYTLARTAEHYARLYARLMSGHAPGGPPPGFQEAAQ